MTIYHILNSCSTWRRLPSLRRLRLLPLPVLVLLPACGLVLLSPCGTATSRADVVLTSEVPGAEEPQLEGNAAEISTTYSPASTFKMIIVMAALENAVAAPETVLPSPDREKLAGKVDLNGREAMFFSSNDYYLKLMDKLSPQIVAEMAARCGFGHAVGDSAAITKANPKDWGHGGRVIYTSPAQQHEFMRRLAKGALPIKPSTAAGLLSTMQWPGRAGYKVYAKSGSFDKIFWFNGMAVKEGAPTKVITVLVTAKDGTRDMAIRRFYDKLGPAEPGTPAIPPKPEPMPTAPAAPHSPQVTPGGPPPLIPKSEPGRPQGS